MRNFFNYRIVLLLYGEPYLTRTDPKIFISDSIKLKYLKIVNPLEKNHGFTIVSNQSGDLSNQSGDLSNLVD